MAGEIPCAPAGTKVDGLVLRCVPPCGVEKSAFRVVPWTYGAHFKAHELMAPSKARLRSLIQMVSRCARAPEVR